MKTKSAWISSGAFILIEALVVIAIIIALISLLIPALNRLNQREEIMMGRRRNFWCLVSACLLSAWAIPSYATVIYEEDFVNNAGFNQGVSTVGWAGYYGSSATDNSSVNSFPVFLSSTTGNPGPGKGYLALSLQSSAQLPVVAVQTGLSLTDVDTISWVMNASNTNANGATGVRLLIQVDGNWYASSALFVPKDVAAGTGTDFANAALANIAFSATLSTSASSWRSLTLTPGSALSLASGTLASDLPADPTITGIGFYDPGAVAITYRIDTVQVNAVPEPATLALLGVAALTIRSRKRTV